MVANHFSALRSEFKSLSAGFLDCTRFEHMDDEKGLTKKCRIFVTIIISSYTRGSHEFDLYYARRWKNQVSFLSLSHNYNLTFLVSFAEKWNKERRAITCSVENFHQACHFQIEIEAYPRKSPIVYTIEWPNKWRDSHNDKVLSFTFYFDLPIAIIGALGSC